MLGQTGSTGRKNAPASLSFLSERIVDRQKRCCKERIVDMLVPIGVGGAGVGLETTVSPLVCIEDAVTGGGEPVFRVGRRKIRKETCGISTPVEAHNDRGTYIGNKCLISV
jgi:hypothetical protein